MAIFWHCQGGAAEGFLDPCDIAEGIERILTLMPIAVGHGAFIAAQIETIISPLATADDGFDNLLALQTDDVAGLAGIDVVDSCPESAAKLYHQGMTAHSVVAMLLLMTLPQQQTIS